MGYGDQNLRGDDEGDIRPHLRAQEEDPDTSEGADESDSSNPESEAEDDSNLSPFEKSQKEDDASDSAMAAGLTDKLGSGKQDEPEGKGLRNFAARNKNKTRQRIAMGLAGSGIIGLVIAVTLIGSGFLKLDQLLNTIDVKTFSRFNASVSGRSDKWLKSYIQIRLLEADGNLDPKDGNLFFRANKVDTNSPIYDWYRTLRTSSFEKDIFEKNGIKFSSVVGPDGKFRTAKITFGGDDSASFNPEDRLNQHQLQVLSEGGFGNNASEFSTVINSLGSDAGHFIDTEVYDSDKAARRDVKRVVKENTKSYQVLKRRALRRDIQNMTGIRSWRFFDKTQTKVEDKKADVQRKILAKVFNGDSNNQKFILCLFGAGPCPSTTDPNDPSNHTAGLPNGAPAVGDDTYTEEGVDADGRPTTTPATLPNGELASGAGGAVSDVTPGVPGAPGGPSTPSQDLIRKLLAKIVGENANPTPTKIWPWLKKIASIDKLFNDDGQGSKITKLVQNARLAQVVSIYATYSIARDQLHTGELTAQEAGALMETTNNFNNSEGWSMITNSVNTGKVAAATTTDISKAEYCNPDHVKTFDEYAWFCDDQKPNSGGNAEKLSIAYNSSVGVVLHPIAIAVSKVQGTFGFIFDFVNSAISTITGPAIEALLKATGLDKTIENVVAAAMTKLLGYMGAGPMFDGSQPGAANFLLAGSAGTAEAGTRASGGIKSTPASLAYSNELAGQYKNTLRQQQSIYDRYASLQNPTSLFATSLMSLSNMSINKMPSQLFSSVLNLPIVLSDALTPKSSAVATIDESSYAKFSGVQTYDIPKNCQDLDPLDSKYVSKATNLSQFLETKDIPVTYELISNSDNFWKAVYEKIGSQADGGQAIAEKIYNCGTLDQRIKGALGATHGYTDDGGYDQNASTSTPSAPTDGGVGINGEGFAFPVKTTRTRIMAGSTKDGTTLVWCTTSQANCHHDYNAADIFAATGTPVVAIHDATVVRAKNAAPGNASSVILKSTPDNQGKSYIFYYTHLLSGSVNVTDGQTVKAGDVLGQVGTNADADNTASHLHIDAQPAPPATTRNGCKGAGCNNGSFQFVNIQPILTSTYGSLPK